MDQDEVRHATSLHMAAKQGHFLILNSLIAYGADVNVTMVNGITPLHFAVIKNQKDCVEPLLAAGANVNVKCSLGYSSDLTPLHLSLADPSSSGTMAHLLLACPGIDVDAKMDKGLTPLYLAAMTGDNSVVKSLLSKGAQVDPKAKPFRLTPYIFASARGNKAVVETLKVYGAEPFKSKFAPLTTGFIGFCMLPPKEMAKRADPHMRREPITIRF